MSTKKLNHQKLEKELMIKKKSCWENWDERTKNKSFAFAEDYKKFLNAAKTESETAKIGEIIARKNGFKNIADIKSIKPGDKVYFVQRGKSVIFARIGRKSLAEGVRIVMSHIDSPHLDFKVNPLYEDENIAFLKTHYYGGIKKYQWPTIALALHGKVYLENGKEVEIVIGEKDSDPVFMITDLLPHLDRASSAGSESRNREVKGEDLNLVIGSLPVKDEKVKEKVKLAVLEYLHKEYGIKEEDLASAELQAVPSEKARDLGFDRSLISGYGHDDRICSFAALQSLLDMKNPESTSLCIWVDREEIGSEGSTGARSNFIDIFISDLLKLAGKEKDLNEVYRLYAKSYAISADVTVAVDPDYKDVHDLRNAARLGFGLVMEKYTGSGGKYHTSEASGKFISQLRKIYFKNKINYQIGGGLGRIDLGGGGTIAMYMANRNMEVIDTGVPLFNMHAPLEIASKADLYSAYLGYRAFFED